MDKANDGTVIARLDYELVLSCENEGCDARADYLVVNGCCGVDAAVCGRHRMTHSMVYAPITNCPACHQLVGTVKTARIDGGS